MILILKFITQLSEKKLMRYELLSSFYIRKLIINNLDLL